MRRALKSAPRERVPAAGGRRFPSNSIRPRRRGNMRIHTDRARRHIPDRTGGNGTMPDVPQRNRSAWI